MGAFDNPSLMLAGLLADQKKAAEEEALQNDYARGGVGPVSQPVFMDRPAQSSWFGIDKLQEPQREVAQAPQGLSEAMQLFQVGSDRPTAIGSGTMRKLREKELESQKLQQEGIASLQKRLEALSKKPEQKGGLQKAIAMAADMWGGGGGAFTRAYDEANPQMTEGQRQAAITQLEDTLRKAKGDLTQSDIDLLKLQLGHEYDLAKLKEKAGVDEPTVLKTKEAQTLQAATNFQESLDRYKKLVDETGITATGSNRAKLDSAYADLQIKYKEAANLGALTGPDKSLMMEAVAPASGVGAWFGSTWKGGLEGVKDSLKQLGQGARMDAQTQLDMLDTAFPGSKVVGQLRGKLNKFGQKGVKNMVGLTPAEQEELMMLDKKYGGK
jgi:hypothetical protein